LENAPDFLSPFKKMRLTFCQQSSNEPISGDQMFDIPALEAK